MPRTTSARLTDVAKNSARFRVTPSCTQFYRWCNLQRRHQPEFPTITHPHGSNEISTCQQPTAGRCYFPPTTACDALSCSTPANVAFAVICCHVTSLRSLGVTADSSKFTRSPAVYQARSPERKDAVTGQSGDVRAGISSRVLGRGNRSPPSSWVPRRRRNANPSQRSGRCSYSHAMRFLNLCRRTKETAKVCFKDLANLFGAIKPSQVKPVPIKLVRTAVKQFSIGKCEFPVL